MKNSDYWKQRFTQLENAQHDLGESAKQEISKMYDRAQAEIEAQIDKWYRRLAKNNEISMAEAKKLLKGKELKEFKWDVGDYIEYGKENAMNKMWMKELENASAKFHISKLEALNIGLEQSLQKLFGQVENITTDTLSESYKEGYYRTMYEFQKGFNVGFDVARINDPYIAKVLYKPWTEDGYNFSENIWKYKTKLINAVHNEITNNLLTGADPQKAIDVIAKKMSNSKFNAGRLVMTEEAYFSSLATGDCFRELDVEKYEILATLDNRTSDICQSMDGKVFDMKDYQAGVTAPPFHCFCRSTTVPAFDKGYDIKKSRAARDGDGKTYYVDGDMRYSEWKAKYVDKTEEKPTPQPMPKSAENNAKAVDKSGESGIIKEKSQTSIKEKRGQLDTGYKGKIPDEKLDEYNSKALEQIKKDTGYSDGDAEEFHKALQIYFDGDYETVLSGNTRTAQTISKGIEKMPVYDGKIYRGMTFSKYSDGNIEDFINLKPGDKIPEKGIITSWSSSKRVAESFGSVSTQSVESSSVILECENNNKGVGVQHISKYGAREAEVLSNAHYEVVDINVKSKYDYVSNRKDLLYFPEDLEDLENELKKQAVCIIKVKEV